MPLEITHNRNSMLKVWRAFPIILACAPPRTSNGHGILLIAEIMEQSGGNLVSSMSVEKSELGLQLPEFSPLTTSCHPHPLEPLGEQIAILVNAEAWHQHEGHSALWWMTPALHWDACQRTAFRQRVSSSSKQQMNCTSIYLSSKRTSLFMATTRCRLVPASGDFPLRSPLVAPCGFPTPLCLLDESILP